MRKLTVSLLTCALAIPALSGSNAALAQDNRWFQVELLVFANRSAPSNPGVATAEQWDATPPLAYPTAARFLVDPRLVRENVSEFGGESLLDEYGRLIITVMTQPEPVAGAAAGAAPPVPGPLPGAAPAVAGSPGIVRPQPVMDAAAGPVAPASALPRPFVLLPPDYQEFRGKVALMQRGGRYSVLFHETWVQTVAPEANSLPIILDRSGDTGQWPLLQGSIKIFLSRYLHLETNLWLNTAGDYLPGSWRMPAPPLGPPSLVIEEVEEITLAAPVDPALAAEDPLLPAVPEPAEAEPVAEVAGPVYPYRHAVLLQQQRRMRSGEVHYIDHPLMGVIVKFTPLTGDQLASIAAAEASALEGIQQE